MKNAYYRSDIDGLRAISVIAVLIFHYWPNHLSGGYTGVDVFFVISGFLITGIIARGIDENKFSFKSFYLNRIIRIFPALLIILTIAMIFGWVMYFPEQFTRLGKHIVGGSLFVSNILLWREVGYFDVNALDKPLLHLWSLGVEEQFYIFWPIFFLIVYKKFKKHTLIILLVTLISFLLNLFLIKSHPTAVFYNPLTRLWELSTGGILALLVRRPNLSQNAYFSFFSKNKNLFSLAGLFLIFWSFFQFHSKLAYPGHYALMPVVGTLLIIQAGEDAWLNRYLLSNKVAVYIGLISYPLYLWHWPLLLWSNDIAVLFKEENGTFIWIAFALSFALATSTKELLESRLQKNRTNKKGGILIILSIIILLTGGYVVYDKGYVGRQIPRGTSYDWPTELNKNQICSERFLTSKTLKDADYCYQESTSPNHVNTILIGDSHANQLLPGLKESSLGEKGFLYIGAGGCSISKGWSRWEIETPSRGPDFCPEVVTTSYQAVKEMKPAVIILSSRMALDTNLADFFTYKAQWRSKYFPHKPQLEALKSEILQGLKELLNENRILIYVYQIPELTFDPLKCSHISPPFSWHNSSTKSLRTNEECQIKREHVEKRQKDYRNIMAEVFKELNSPRIFTFDPMDILCDKKYCHVEIDNSFMYRDNNHLSVIGSKFVWSHLERDFNKFTEELN